MKFLFPLVYVKLTSTRDKISLKVVCFAWTGLGKYMYDIMIANDQRNFSNLTSPPGWESIPGLLKRFTNTGSGFWTDI